MPIRMSTGRLRRLRVTLFAVAFAGTVLTAMLSRQVHHSFPTQKDIERLMDLPALGVAVSKSLDQPEVHLEAQEVSQVAKESVVEERDVQCVARKDMNTSLEGLPKYVPPDTDAGKYNKAIKGMGKRMGLTLDLAPFEPCGLHASLKDYYSQVPVSSDTTPNLWDDPTSKIPEWMKSYLRWHKYTRSKIDDDADHSDGTQRFVVMQCLDTDSNCGGVSDRLKPLPLILRYAYYTKRLLLIHWNRPGALEEFLVPPKGGINWQAPKWLLPTIYNKTVGIKMFSDDDLQPWTRSPLPLVRSRFQNYQGGMYSYDAQLVNREKNFTEVFHDVWKTFFTPSVGVRAVIERDMNQLGLVPGEYVSAHARVLYAMKDRDEKIKKNWAINAVNCATELQPGKPIFFASDSTNATFYGKRYVEAKGAKISIRIPNPDPPVHIDKVDDWRQRDISAFYDSFVDIYVMAQAGCVTYNKGGFGVLALIVGRTWECGVRQDALERPIIRKPCKWVEDVSQGTSTTEFMLRENLTFSKDPIYVEPMFERLSASEGRQLEKEEVRSTSLDKPKISTTACVSRKDMDAEAEGVPPYVQPLKYHLQSLAKSTLYRAKQMNLTLEEEQFDACSLHASLKDFYGNIPTSPETTDLWEDANSAMPDWMKAYLRWHKHTRELLHDADVSNGTQRFIVMQCLDSDGQCGGLSDRLKPLPLILRTAYYTKRLLLIHWSRPGSLQEFLVPPKGGIDWRVPKWLLPRVETRGTGEMMTSYPSLQAWSRTELPLVRSRFQDYHGGMHPYDSQLVNHEKNFTQVFHDVWRTFFTPSKEIRTVIETDMNRLGLTPGQYVSAHVRVLYAMDDRDESVKQNWAINAVNCASELQPSKPIFFASDSSNATHYAREYVETKNGRLLTRTPNPNPPVHIDMVSDWKERNISDFYDSFVDIYMMAQAGCMTYNVGGYGVLALLTSRNWNCGVRQDALKRPEIREPCQWVDDASKGTPVTKMMESQGFSFSTQSIYAEPMVLPD